MLDPSTEEYQKYTDKLFALLEEDKIKVTDLDLLNARLNRGITLNKIGKLYYNKQNYAGAVAWFQKAADVNYPPGQCNMGCMYRNGFGVKKSDRSAFKYYHIAACNGDNIGQYYVGNMYEFGKGVNRDPDEAVIWYLKAAKQGDAFAMYSLGNIYELTFKDFQKAVNWYKKSSDRGIDDSRKRLNRLFSIGFEPIEDEDFEIVDKAKIESIEKACEQISLDDNEKPHIAETVNNDDTPAKSFRFKFW